MRSVIILLNILNILNPTISRFIYMVEIYEYYWNYY